MNTTHHAEPGTAKASRDDVLTHKGGIMALEVVSEYLKSRQDTLMLCIAAAVKHNRETEAARLRERFDVLEGVALKIEDYRDGLTKGIRRFEEAQK